MISIQMTKERRRLLVIGGILLLLGVGYRLLPALSEIGAGNVQKDAKIQTISKYQKKIKEKASLDRHRLQLTRDLENLRHGLLKGQTPALAAVTMQNRLNEIAGNLDINIQSMRVLKPGPVENTDLVLVSVQLTAEVEMRQLKELLYRIEASENYLQIRKLQVNQRSDKLPVQLRTIMTVDGFMLKPDEESASG